MPEVVENLLDSIPVGAILIDPKEGSYPEARLGAVELVEQGNGYSVKLTWMDLVDSQSRPFEQQDRVTIPTSESEDFIHRMFLTACHDLEVVPRSFRSKLHAETEADRDRIVEAFTSKVGNQYSITLKADKNGYMRTRITRKK